MCKDIGWMQSLRGEILQIYRELNGKGHRDTLTVMANLVMMYRDLGRLDDSNTLLQQRRTNSKEFLVMNILLPYG